LKSRSDINHQVLIKLR